MVATETDFVWGNDENISFVWDESLLFEQKITGMAPAKKIIWHPQGFQL